MSYLGHTFMGPVDHQSPRPSERLAMYLRSRYRQEHRAKRLAKDIECLPKTAANILAGHWPSDLHFSAIVRHFGRDVLDAVFGQDIDATLARLTAEARALEEQLQDINARTRRLKGAESQLSLFDDAAEDKAHQARLNDGGRS